jgi:hypothetical protein
MTQQQLDGAHIGARFEQMCGESMPKRMRCNRFENPTASMRSLAGSLHGVGFYVAAGSFSQE